MKVRPVLDILQGRVVRGVAGNREEYRPIVSQLTKDTSALGVARAIRDTYGLDRMYLADLDGILSGRPNLDLYRQLVSDGFDLMVDTGVGDVLAVQEFQNAEHGAELIVGLESCESPEDLRQMLKLCPDLIFSLDLVRGHPKRSSNQRGWNDEPTRIVKQISELRAKSILVLDLADVGMGTGGSTGALCRFIRHASPSMRIIAGGGVRFREDLSQFREHGVDEVLVASALHDRRLSREDLEIA